MSATPPLFRDCGSSDAGVCLTHLVMTSGATGAVPSTFIKGKGIASVTRNAAGLYTIVTNDRASAFLNFNASVKQTGSYAKSGACDARLVAQLIDSATKSIQIQVVDGDGDATELASGDILYVTVETQWMVV